MALLLLMALAATCIFVFYYELVWKKFEREKGRSLVWVARDLLFGGNAQPVLTSSPWQNWQYRTLVELHRRNRLYPEEAAKLAGVSAQDIERYFDELEFQGKIQSAGDAERGIFYTPVSSLTNLPVSPEFAQSPSLPKDPAPNGLQARGFE